MLSTSSYLARSQLLTGAHRTSPMVASDKASSKAVKTTKTVNVRPRSNPVCALGPTRLQPLEAGGEQRREEEEGSMLKRKEWWNQRRQGRHNRLLQMETKAEVHVLAILQSYNLASAHMAILCYRIDYVH